MTRRSKHKSRAASCKAARTRAIMKAARREQPQCEFCGQCSTRSCHSAEKASMCFLRIQTAPPTGMLETITVSKDRHQ